MTPQEVRDALEEAHEDFYQACRKEDSRYHYEVFAKVAMNALGIPYPGDNLGTLAAKVLYQGPPMDPTP